LHHARILFW